VAWVVPLGETVCGGGGPVDWPAGVPLAVDGVEPAAPDPAGAVVEAAAPGAAVVAAGCAGMAVCAPGGGAITNPPATGRSGSRTSM